jgi:hypothetical protein
LFTLHTQIIDGPMSTLLWLLVVACGASTSAASAVDDLMFLEVWKEWFTNGTLVWYDHGFEWHMRGLPVGDLVAFDEEGWRDFTISWRNDVWFKRLGVQSQFNHGAMIVEQLNAHGSHMWNPFEGTPGVAPVTLEEWLDAVDFHFDHSPGAPSWRCIDLTALRAEFHAAFGPMPLNTSLVVQDDDHTMVYNIPYDEIKLSPNPTQRQGSDTLC